MILPRHLSTVFNPGRPVNRSGLMGWWTFDDGSAQDVSGHNNYGVLSGTPPPQLAQGIFPAVGAVGHGLLFDGANSYVNVPNFSSAGLKTITVVFSVWHFSVAGNPTIAANSQTDADNGGFQIFTGSSLLAQFGNGTSQSGFNTSALFSTGRWYRVCVTCDVPNNLATGYVNGASVVTAGAPTGAIAAGLTTLGFGRNNVYAGNFLSGILDDVRIVSRVWSGGEAADDYFRSLKSFDEAEMDVITVPGGGGGSTINFRKTLSPIAGRVGSRQSVWQ